MSLDVEIRIHTSEFVAWLRRSNEQGQAAAQQVLGQGVALALAHAQATTSFKDRTGELRRSFSRGQKSRWVHYLRASARHAKFVNDGTKDSSKGPIVASGRALRFYFRGTLMFRKSVKHKGLKARHFMEDAADAGARYIDWNMENEFGRAFRF